MGDSCYLGIITKRWGVIFLMNNFPLFSLILRRLCTSSKLSTSEGSSEANKIKTFDFSGFGDPFSNSNLILSEPFSAPSEFLFYQ
jgi:hypothetical protein